MVVATQASVSTCTSVLPRQESRQVQSYTSAAFVLPSWKEHNRTASANSQQTSSETSLKGLKIWAGPVMD